MTWTYRLYYTAVWSVGGFGAIVGLLASIPWGAVAAANSDWTAAAILWSTGLGFLLITISLRMHTPRVLIRAGAFPSFFRGDVAPRDEAELRKKVRAIRGDQIVPRRPSLVGGGWGHFIAKRGPPAPRLFMYNYTGKIKKTQRWRAGTTIAEVVKYYEEQGTTLPSHPTMDYISIGSWFALGNHGNEGPVLPDSSDMLKLARVLDMDTDTVEEMKYAGLRSLFDNAENRARYCILDIEFQQAKENIMLQKEAIEIRNAADAARWLNVDAYLRMCFLGAARDYAFGLRWTLPYDDDTHMDPHCCSRWSQFVQVDILSTWWGWHETPLETQFNGKTTLANANRWIPPIFPLQNIFILIAGYHNFEVFFKFEDEEGFSPDTMVKLTSGMIALHKEYGGRSEIRNRELRGRVCLDVSMRSEFGRVFRFLHDEMKIVRVALHLGKFNEGLNTHPCTRVELGTL